MTEFYLIYQSVSPNRLHICHLFSGLTVPQTMCRPRSGPGTVTAVVYTMWLPLASATSMICDLGRNPKSPWPQLPQLKSKEATIEPGF